MILVAVLVFVYSKVEQLSPFYQNSDIFHFALNLLFLQKGFFDSGFSFNGP